MGLPSAHSDVPDRRTGLAHPEQGTSFERIWLGAHGAPTHHILFHFLGHAVELEERCTGEPIAQFEWGPVPCPWSIDASRSLLFVNDGPVRYELKERSGAR